MYSSAVAGSESTYVCECCYYNASGVVLRVGGNYSQAQNHGAFCLVGNYAASDAYASIGCRLQKLPLMGSAGRSILRQVPQGFRRVLCKTGGEART